MIIVIDDDLMMGCQWRILGRGWRELHGATSGEAMPKREKSGLTFALA
jgi:hypothetical protein